MSNVTRTNNRTRKAEALVNAPAAEAPAAEALVNAPTKAEAAVIESLSSKAKQALVSKESGLHTLFIGKHASGNLDAFVNIRFFADKSTESFATVSDNGLLPTFTHIDSLNLAQHWLMLSVSFEAYGYTANGAREGKRDITSIRASAVLIPVRVRYLADHDRFELIELGKTLYRYSKASGFKRLTEIDVARNLPGMDSAGLLQAAERKARSYVQNNAQKVNQRVESFNGNPTLYGLWKAAKAAKAPAAEAPAAEANGNK